MHALHIQCSASTPDSPHKSTRLNSPSRTQPPLHVCSQELAKHTPGSGPKNPTLLQATCELVPSPAETQQGRQEEPARVSGTHTLAGQQGPRMCPRHLPKPIGKPGSATPSEQERLKLPARAGCSAFAHGGSSRLPRVLLQRRPSQRGLHPIFEARSPLPRAPPVLASLHSGACSGC